MDPISYYPEDITQFKKQALQWACSFNTACYLDSNGYSDRYSSFEVLIAVGPKDELKGTGSADFERLNAFLQQNPAFIPGFFSYDLKNQTEKLSSANPDFLSFPDLYFFVPEHVIVIRDNKVELYSELPEAVLSAIAHIRLSDQSTLCPAEIKSRFSRQEYIETVNLLQNHIHRGDIYEINFCQEFYCEEITIAPLEIFNSLNRISPTPFASFFKYNDNYILSSSPERFLKKQGSKLISQPIKGTAKRGSKPEEDLAFKESLRHNIKEQSENVMIVDLVRNDLTRCAVPGTVQVEELFGIYSFEQVHQMISTVVSEADPRFDNAEIIKTVFPMGSMTGAPKIRAMELIDQYERSKRGIFSGSIGYFSAEGNFDFDVVIRTILYNSETKYLSFQVGSAITFASDPAREYDECLLKAEAIMRVLSGKG